MTKRVDVLLASYNGESYISEQIDSILQQTYEPIHLFIRDDCSTDNTLKIIDRFIKKYPNKITILPSDKNVGIVANFSLLMEHSTADYLVCSDQDDVWFPEKIEKTMLVMQQLEQKWGNVTPLLVHTDLQVVDRSLKLINPSFWHLTYLNPKHDSLNRLLMQNVVTGCTMMLNRSLLKIALPIPSEVIMHDWWIALVASAFGKIESIDEPTIKYRQHSANATGATKYSIKTYLKKIHYVVNQKKIKGRLSKHRAQAAAFLKRYSNNLDLEKVAIVEAFVKMRKSCWHVKLFYMIRYQFYKQGLLRNLAVIFSGI